MKKYNGFTLVELMIVVAIIGVLSAIAFPSYNSYMKKSGRADAKVGMSKLADKQERYYLQNNTYTNLFTAAGLNTSNISEEGYYAFSITPTAAADLVKGYVITATAIATKSQAGDTTTSAGDCTQLVLDSTGIKSAPLSNDEFGTDPAVPDCW